MLKNVFALCVLCVANNLSRHCDETEVSQHFNFDECFCLLPPVRYSHRSLFCFKQRSLPKFTSIVSYLKLFTASKFINFDAVVNIDKAT